MEREERGSEASARGNMSAACPWTPRREHVRAVSGPGVNADRKLITTSQRPTLRASPTKTPSDISQAALLRQSVRTPSPGVRIQASPTWCRFHADRSATNAAVSPLTNDHLGLGGAMLIQNLFLRGWVRSLRAFRVYVLGG